MLNVEKLSHDGRGIAHHPDGKLIFVRNGLPGEDVVLELKRKQRHYDEALAVEIHHPSVDRVTPKCAAFGRCGACSLQHLEVSAQILAKQDWLKEKLSQVKLEPQEWLPPLQEKVWGYRHKARLGVRFVRKKERVLIGFREAESNFLTDMTRCEVLHPSIGTHLDTLADLLATLSIKDQIAQIEVAVDDTQTALIIRHLAPFTDEDLQKLEPLYTQWGWIVFLQPKGLDTIHQVYPAEKIQLSYTVMGKTAIQIPFQPGDFTQVNFSLNAKMVRQALDLLDPQATDTILDLFCGLGNFSLPIAQYAGKVIAVEGDTGMLDRARANAKNQGIQNIEFFVSNLFELEKTSPFYGEIDQLFLDPPRAGAEAVVRNIEYWNPKRIVYVSCDPVTLVRDLAILVQEKKYKLEKIGVMDMFPHTAHLETMALLTRV
ncbi:MAG: 23S rRNA (uracil(1939)-C(5))-methyltransferase RlmD [Gammaproteobacteria bacterium]|nr:23S rRNA (uracil(1939)-C(5))-methyltransferase RlmD [Gammaproteobacteria bacterium]